MESLVSQYSTYKDFLEIYIKDPEYIKLQTRLKKINLEIMFIPQYDS